MLYTLLCHLSLLALHLSASPVEFNTIDSVVVVPPRFPKSSSAKHDVAFVLVPEAETDHTMYQPLVDAFQSSFYERFSVWFAYVPANSMPNLFAKGSRNFLSEHAFPRNGTIYLLGHGTGGKTSQTWLTVQNRHISDISGLILLGSNLARTLSPFISIPTLTVCGEYDGLATPLRCAESFYQSKQNVSSVSIPFRSVAIVRSMTHSSFLAFGNSSQRPKWLNMDIKARDTLNSSRTSSSIASIVLPFISHLVLPSSDVTAQSAVGQQAAEEFFSPIIDALNLEGNYHLQRPCDSDHPSPHCPFYPQYPIKTTREPSDDSQCRCESTFTNEAVKMIFERNSSYYKVLNADAFHFVSTVKPIHHPHIWSNCTSPKSYPCMLNMTTITENVYRNEDQVDSPGSSVAATEIRMKLKSWQSVLDVTTHPGTAHALNFNGTDPLTVCQSLNKYSFERALQIAPKSKVDYWQANGIPLSFDSDSDVAIEPLFTFTPLEEKIVADSDGHLVNRIKSPSFRVALDNLVADMVDMIGESVPALKDMKGAMNGYHYCKVISPARVLEWIYIDGLRV